MEALFVALLVIIGIPAVIATTVHIFRYQIRHYLFRARRGTLDDMVWSEIIHEGTTERERRITQADVSGLLTLNDSIRDGMWPYRRRGVVSYVWYRKGDGSIHLYVGVDPEHYGDGSAVKLAASSIHATAVRTDAPDIPIDSFAIGYRGRNLYSSVRDSLEDRGQMAEAISSSMKDIPEGETAAIIMTLDPMRNSEARRLVAYINEEGVRVGGVQATYGVSMKSETMVSNAIRVSFAATASTNNAKAPIGLLSTAINAISTLGWQVNVRAAQNPLVRETLRRGYIVVPSFSYFNPRWYFQAQFRSRRRVAGTDDKVGGLTAPPSNNQVIYLHPMALLEAVSFPDRFSAFGADVHKATTQSRGLPNGMLEVQWPLYIGQSGTGQMVYLDLSDLHYSLYTAGAPGSGKTNFLQVIYADAVWASRENMAGLQITPIWGETKGSGAYSAWEIARNHPRAVFVDTHNPASLYRLALEGRRISEGATVQQVRTNVANLVSSLQFAYGDGIRAASRELLDASIMIGMLLSPDEIRYLELDAYVNADRPNVINLARFILGGDTRVQPGAKLIKLQEDYERSGEANSDQRLRMLCDTIGSISRFITPTGAKNFAQQLSSPLNKLSDLMSTPAAWTPDQRIDISVDQLPAHFAPIVINMGPYMLSDGSTSSIQNTAARRLMLITNFLIWDYIKANCSDWQAQGKRVPLFFDEVADIAVNSQSDDVMNVLADALKEGRSRGCSYFVGSQFPDQMPYQAKASVLSSRTKFWFNLHEADALRMAVSDLASGNRDEVPYTQDNIRGLDDGVCVGIMKRLNTVTPPFTLHVPYAPKWAEFLLAPGSNLQTALAEYVEWDQRSKGQAPEPVVGDPLV